MLLLLKKTILVPVMAAGPFIATVMDAVGIAFYFQFVVFLIRVAN